ncbi:MAG TPA: transposase [Verrucomicrobiae bacterium]|nr:transposase [Verrucomicrobiae bacterium]
MLAACVGSGTPHTTHGWGRRAHKGQTAADVLNFFKLIGRTVPRTLEVLVVLDNLSADKGPDIRAWLANSRQRRWHLHFTPTSSFWVNLVERWFKELTDKRLRRGRFTGVAGLVDAILLWAERWNDDPQPFVWHKPAAEIMEKVQRGRATLHQSKSETDHWGCLPHR